MISLNDAKDIWRDAHQMWMTGTQFPDEPQASVAWCYATATMRLLERRAKSDPIR